MNLMTISEASDIFWDLGMTDQEGIHGNQAGIANY
jgi:hypothetical protein